MSTMGAMKRFLCAVVLAGSAATLAAQQQTKGAQQPAGGAQQANGAPQPADQTQLTFRAGVNFITVDAYVTDSKGNPITDLKQSDFDITEDNKPQKVEQFRLIKIDGNPKPGEPPPPADMRDRDQEEREAAREDTRLFVIFLDDYHTRLGSSLAIRQPLIQWVQTNLRPLDMVAIMYPLTPVQDIDFTRNTDKIINAISHFEGRKYRYEPRNLFEEQYQRAPTEVVEQIRNQVVETALRGLSVRLGSIRDSRKTILYVSEGMSNSLPPQLRSADASMPGIGNPNAHNPLAGEQDPNEQTYTTFAQADLYSDLREVFIAATRNNCAIYTVDPRGLATNEFDIDEPVGPQQDQAALTASTNVLRSIASETDGRAIVGRNDIARGLEQALQDSTAYYLLGYTSTQAPVDGKFHQIKVTLSAAARRRGLQVRARRGYWAATQEDISKAEKAEKSNVASVVDANKPVMEALANISVNVQAGKYVRTWLGTERGQNGRTKITLVWEPLPKTASNATTPTAGRVSLIAATDSGDLVYRGRTPDTPQFASINAPSTTGSVAQSAGAANANAPQMMTFEARPGPLELRISVEGSGGGVLDQEIRKITVPDMTGAQPMLSTPRVYPARTPREFQAFASNANAVPPASRDYSRTQRLLVRFDSYGPGNEVPVPTAQLLNNNGQKFADVPVAAATAGGTHQIDLNLATIPPGEYVLQILTKSAAGGEAKQLVAFRVVS